jgi:hypothetical protein
MSKVFFDVGLLLDGYLARSNRRPGNPLGDGGIAIHEWMFRMRYRVHPANDSSTIPENREPP